MAFPLGSAAYGWATDQEIDDPVIVGVQSVPS